MFKDKKFKILKILIGLVVTAVVLVFIIRSFGDDVEFVEQSLQSSNWYFNIGSLALYIFGFLCLSFSWTNLVQAMGKNIPWKKGIRVWSISQVMSYIPGGIWSVGGRAMLAKKYKLSPLFTTASIGVEWLFIVLTSGFLIVFLNFIRLVKDISFSLSGLILLVIVLIVFFADKLAALIRIVSKKNIQILKGREFNRFVLLQLASWIFFSAGFCILAYSLHINLNVFLLSFVFLSSWLAGFVVVVSPMGLGAREGALLLLLSPVVGNSVAALLAIASRLFWTAGEFISLGVVVLISKLKK